MSGSGKSTVMSEMIDSMNYQKAITTTTRPPRPNEVDGVDYHFLTKRQFLEKKQNKEFLEDVENGGNFYGVQLSAFDQDFGDNHPIIVLDPYGVVSATEGLTKKGYNVVSVFLDDDHATCIQRVKDRASSDEEKEARYASILEKEKDWNTFTNYTHYTKPLATIKENAKDIDDFFKSNIENKLKQQADNKSEKQSVSTSKKYESPKQKYRG